MTQDEHRHDPCLERGMLTSGDLQAWLGLGRTTIFALLNDPIQGIPNYRIGRKIVIRQRDVEDWLERHRYGAGGS